MKKPRVLIEWTGEHSGTQFRAVLVPESRSGFFTTPDQVVVEMKSVDALGNEQWMGSMNPDSGALVGLIRKVALKPAGAK